MKKKSILLSTLLISVLSIGSVAVQFAHAFGPRVFSVARVAPSDQLNVRVEPGVANEIVGGIPANGEGIVVIGDKEKIGTATWANISWGPVRGWVNDRYLTASYLSDDDKKDTIEYRPRTKKSKGDASAVTLECGGINPFWNIDLSENDIRVNIKEDNYSLPIYSRRASSRYEDSVVVKGKKRGETANIYLTKDNSCKDGITNINYPYTIRAVINGKSSYSGCCSSVTD